MLCHASGFVITRRDLLLGAGGGALGVALGGGGAAAVALGVEHRHEAVTAARARKSAADDRAVREAVGIADPYGRPNRLGDSRVVWSTTTTGPYAALTFDDGPTPEFTPRILDALASAGVQATFFVIGYNAVRHADLLREIVAQGHEVGNHTWSHLDHTTIGADEIRHEIVRCTDEVQQIIQRPLVGFRPPRGELTGFAVLVAAELGYDVFLWSVVRGPGGTATSQAVQDYLSATVQPGDIVDLHDGLGRGTFDPTASFARSLAARREVEIEALPGALGRIADRSLQLTTLTALLARSGPL
jgi:peptidoglycan/xylan/chitin deacetylase (PgdA/CDA1 family)